MVPEISLPRFPRFLICDVSERAAARTAEPHALVSIAETWSGRYQSHLSYYEEHEDTYDISIQNFSVSEQTCLKWAGSFRTL